MLTCAGRRDLSNHTRMSMIQRMNAAKNLCNVDPKILTKVNCFMTTHLLVLSSRPAILNRRGSTPVSTVLRKSVRKVASHAGVFRGARISSLPTGREEIRAPLKNACVGGYQERGVKGVRIQNISWGEPPPEPPLEACAFGAHFGNRSVFILDLRLLKSFPKTFPSK